MPSPDVRVERFRFSELRIPFKVAFRHASAERSETETAWIEAVAPDDITGTGESCPRSYVTGETLQTVRAFIEAHESALKRDVVNGGTLRDWVEKHRAEIDRQPAAWCGLELALLDAFGKARGVPVETLLSLPPLAGRFRYTAVLGDASPKAFRSMAEQYWQVGFRDFKVKLSNDCARDRDKLSVFGGWPESTRRIRADANNLWRDADEAIAGVRALGHQFFAIEEPIGAGRYQELSRISQALGCPIVLDESCVRPEQLSALPGPPSQWLVNVRVSKMGGIIRSLDVVAAARAAGIGLIVGAQVGETSLLTRAALTVAREAGESLVAQEGAFGTHLLERDVCDPPLMFGAGGVLDLSTFRSLDAPGLGLSITSSRPTR